METNGLEGQPNEDVLKSKQEMVLKIIELSGFLPSVF